MIGLTTKARFWLHKEFAQGLYAQKFAIFAPLIILALPLAFGRNISSSSSFVTTAFTLYAVLASAGAVFWVWQVIVVAAERREKSYQKHVKPMLSSEHKDG